MYNLGKIVLYSAEDICEAFHTSKETAYKLLSLPQATVVHLGRKMLISEEMLQNLFNTKIKV